MVNKKTLFKSALVVLIATYTIFSAASDSSDPQFSDYQTVVSSGPFSNKIHLNSKQQTYSLNWKQSIQSELSKQVNFSGHYRLFTTVGGKGKECSNEAWVCGWVIDKITGEVVSALPGDNDGSHGYASVGDNGTPVGYPFEVDAYKDSSMMVITDQAIPSDKNSNDSPTCKSVVYNFKDNKFVKLIESEDGCNID
ncbi:hypothetical protein ACGVWS_06185 [Enterobacteriaceae bacterium LUAb1]